jgi:energy-coupling factor transporter ATP-binding protein EcfA2
MLDLQLREEFRGARLRGTTIDFNNDAGTGALDLQAKDFLRITYPSIDLVKTVKAAAPGANRAVVLIGNRGQGKSHLMAALCHLLRDPEAGEAWLKDWSEKLGQPDIASISLRSAQYVIAEPLHEHRFAFLWDILFAKHPKGEFARGKWEARKTEVPGKDILLEMFKAQPTALLLDEFQTWFDGLSDTGAQPRQVWAFNFIQLLSEIAETNPELLTLVVSVREGSSNAAQQLFRVNPVRVDFKGEQAQTDRRRLLLYRIFENRINIPAAQIEPLIETHFSEYMRLGEKPASESEKQRGRFVEAWPYSPELLRLLDDEVIFAVQAQGTRDLVRILVELFKARGETSPVLTPADFDLSGDEAGSAASLIDTVGIEHHKQLRDKALRNLVAVEEALGADLSSVPHLREIVSALWLRSLSLDNQRVGAEPDVLQIDVTRGKKVDDNAFQAELAAIENNSYNIHKIGTRLVFKLEENARTRLLAHARNDKLFLNGEDVDCLSAEIRHCIGGDSNVSGMYRTIVLKREWNNAPWDELEERERPSAWDGRIPLIVLPVYPDKLNAVLGAWLKKFLPQGRNTVRFLLPKKNPADAHLGNVLHDKELVLSARAAYLARLWQASEPAYKALAGEFTGTLKTRVADRFDRFAVLRVWNHEDSAKCEFNVEPHGTKGDKIPTAVQEKIRQNLFIDEDFDEMVVFFAEKNLSMAKLLSELREPRGGGKECIPWLGEAEAKDAVLRVCAAGRIAINVRGLKSLQAVPGETEDVALRRMKRDFDVSGRQLEDTLLSLPGTSPSSAGQTQTEPPAGGSATLPGIPGGTAPAPGPGNIFGDSSSGAGSPAPISTRVSSEPTSGLNLLQKIETWRVGPATPVRNVSIRIGSVTGAQLAAIVRALPDGLLYGLDADKEEN